VTIRDADRYLAAVVSDYRQTCATGFADEGEAKRALWKAAVVVCEVASNPDLWLSELRTIALDTLKESRIETTIRSAKRRAVR